MSNQWGILDVFKKDFKEDPDVIKKNNIINKPKQEHKSSDKTKFKTNLGCDHLTYVLLLINIYNASERNWLGNIYWKNNKTPERHIWGGDGNKIVAGL